MLEFIQVNVGSILVVLAVIIGLIALVKRNEVDKAKEMLLFMVLKAEALFGGGTGDIKYSFVQDILYDKLPAIVQVFFTAKQIDKMVENAVEEMKILLSRKSVEEREELFIRLRQN